MNDFQSSSRHTIAEHPAGIMLLLFLAAVFAPIVFAGSSPTVGDRSPTEVKPLPAAAPELPSTSRSCQKSPMQCSSICQSFHSAEVRAAELKKISKEARTNADKAAKRAKSAEKQASKKLQKMGLSGDAPSSASANPPNKSLWKLAAAVPRIFVPSETRVRANEQEKEAVKYEGNPFPDNTIQEAAESLRKSREASESAEKLQKIAADAKGQADQARLYADSLRQSYRSCLKGKESH
jgi:hypothetical protein